MRRPLVLLSWLFLTLTVSQLAGARKAFAVEACPVLSFKAAPNYRVGANPRSVAAGDFNNDGNQDLVLVYAGFPESVAVLLGAGGGRFGEASRFSGGQAPTFAAVADFNEDAKQDLAVVNFTGTVTIFLGGGDGKFGAPTDFRVGVNPNFAAVGDFNKDGHADLAVVNTNSENISVLTGNGAGGFGAAVNHHVGPAPRSLAVNDLNGDGKLDLVVVNSTTANDNAAILSGDGAGNFGPASFFNAGTFPSHVTTGDLNGDGRADLVFTNFDVISVRLANAGGFSAPINHAGAFAALTVADFNGDGKADVAGINANLNVAGVRFGNGAGSFSGQVIFHAGGTPLAVAPGDFNRDGIADLAVANFGSGDVSIVLGQGGGAFVAADNYPVASSATTVSSVVAGDFNRDGRPDMVAVDYGRGRVATMLNTGAGRFSAPTYASVRGIFPISAAAGDFDSDGILDLAVANQGSDDISIMKGDGAGGFTWFATVGAGVDAIFATAADFDKDGKLDLVLINRSPHSVTVMLGTGAGGFGSPSNFSVGIAPTSVAHGDFNGDGSPDLVVTNYDSNNVTILLGNGAGGVASTANLPTSSHPNSAAVSDLNGDGRLDLAVSHEDPSKVTILLGNGGGGFTPAGEHAVGIFPNSVVAADFNGDGSPDLAVTNGASRTLSVLPGDGAGGFGAAASFGVGADPRAAAVADFNGDSRPDIAVSNYTFGDLTVILSAPCPAAASTVRFEAAGYGAGEGAGRALVTVARAGDASGAASVTVRTADDPEAVPCATVNGRAYARCDYATTVETLSWAAGDSQPKTVTIPLVDDGRAEGDETLQVRLSNPQGAAVGDAGAATVTIHDNETAEGPNPIGDSRFFVRQHYLDFLSREPEAGEPWTGILDRCPDVNNTDPNSPSAGCDRLRVSESFFRSPEFYLKGLYTYLFYRVAFGRVPLYEEITPDMRGLAGATGQEVFRRRAEYAEAFARRPEFAALYGAMANRQYVDVLLNGYGLAQVTTEDPADFEGAGQVTLTRQQMIDALDAGALSRAQVLRAVVQSAEVDAAEFHGAFVAMQYYGYLRRTPEQSGYDAWLRVIKEDPNNVRVMVNGFMNSQEYRLRFGRL